MDEFHWVFIPPDSIRDCYSGMADTLDQAVEDTLLSAEHFLLNHN